MTQSEAIDDATGDLLRIEDRLNDILEDVDDSSGVYDEIQSVLESVSDARTTLEYAEEDEIAFPILETLNIGFLETIAPKMSVGDQQEIERVLRETCIRLGYSAEVSE